MEWSVERSAARSAVLISASISVYASVLAWRWVVALAGHAR